MRKAILIVGDGMADRQIKELNGRSPLERAYTPNMDKLAKEGVGGLRSPYKPGKAVESDVANLILLGYDPEKCYLGRGAFEALGLGLRLEEGDLAFRVNLATVKNGVIVDRRAGRFNWDKQPIVDALDGMKINDVEVRFYPGVEHRAVVVFKGENLSRKISGNDPHKIGVSPNQIIPLEKDPAAQRTAEIVSQFVEKSAKILENLEINKKREEKGLLPANFLLLRGPGMYRKLEQFQEKYKVKGCVVCGFPLVRGVGRAIGLECIQVKGATGRINTNYIGKAEAVVRALKNYDFVFLHFKAPDTASHDGNIDQKIRVIERIDEAIGKILESVSLDELVIAVTSDHATPISVRDHTGDLVPFTMYSTEIIPDDVEAFSERHAMKGGYGTIDSTSLVDLLINFSRKPLFVEF